VNAIAGMFLKFLNGNSIFVVPYPWLSSFYVCGTDDNIEMVHNQA